METVRQVKHSSASNEWYTPPGIIDRVHRVLGYPDLDPASCPEANKRVKARRYYTKEQDGLATPWLTWGETSISVFCNPPGGKIGNKSQTALFWQELITLKNEGCLTHAIFVGFNIEALAITQGCTEPMAQHICCVPRSRVRFDHADGGKNPAHANVICYVAGTKDRSYEFYQAFASLGSVLVPYRSPQ